MTNTKSTASATSSNTNTLWSSLSDICKLLDIPLDRSMANEESRFQHVQYKAGQHIYTVGQTFDMLYVVSAGFLKTVMIDDDGNEQILCFPMKGDLLGIDGIHNSQYSSEVTALSDCTVILVPFKQLSALGRTHPALENAMYGAMSAELAREHAMVAMLGSLSVEARVARFIVFMSERFADMGYSSKQFNLRMTRQEIGSYLGTTMETVSRTMSAFDHLGLISLNQRAVEIHDMHALKTLRRLPPTRQRTVKTPSTVKQPSFALMAA
jgi:CRP/FNR family transcriptional regulator